MLPPHLFSAYKQYKEDTDAVASWLATTAKRYGYPSDLLEGASGASQSTSTARVKGKARKAAKAAAAAATESSSKPSASSKYTIAIKIFIPLAEFIATRTPPVTVPTTFSSIINRVIRIRSTFDQRISRHGQETDRDSKQNHDYFVSILEKVREVLNARLPASVLSDTSDTQMQNATNIFAALTVYEPSDEFLASPPIAHAPQQLKHQQQSKDTVIYEAEQQLSIEDAFMAYAMMISDLNKIRAQVRWIWSNHRAGIFDAVAAAVATDSAISLARDVLEEMAPIFKFRDPYILANEFFDVSAGIEGRSPDQILTDKDKIDFGLYDIMDDTYLVSFRIMRRLQKMPHMQPKGIPLHDSNWTYDPTCDRKSLSGKKKYAEDREILHAYVAELVTVSRSVEDYPVSDEFLRGIAEMENTGDIPFYLVFAAQIHLDIHHEMRAGIERPYQSLEHQLKQMDKAIESHLKYHETQKPAHWPAMNDQMLRDLRLRMSEVLGDPVYMVKVDAFRLSGKTIPDTILPNRILKSSPVMAGLMLYHFRAEMYTVGIIVANSWGSIAHTWHFYNMLVRENLLHGHWADMELVEGLLGSSNLHIGGAPKNRDEYLAKFLIQMGLSAAVFADPKRRRDKIKGFARAGGRYIKIGAPVSHMFAGRYLRHRAKVDWTAESLDEILSRSDWDKDLKVENNTLEAESKDLDNKTAPPRKKKAVDGARVAPETLIRSLALVLQAEAVEFAFPYLIMHHQCWRVLRAVKASCEDLLPQKYGHIYMPGENQDECQLLAGWMLKYIFLDADAGCDGRLLRTAARTVEAFIAREQNSSLAVGIVQAWDLPVVFEEVEVSDDEDT
jgi:hypothetical protein